MKTLKHHKRPGPFILKSLGGCAAALLLTMPGAQAAPITIDDFNVNEGHFTSNPPTGSGSSRNIATASTADRITDEGPLEGTGQQKLVLIATTEGTAMTLRHLSGGGSPANNLAFSTTDGEDGWIGFYVKTTNTGWTAQIFLEGTVSADENRNGGIPKEVIADGEWHLYEWNLDDNSGEADGWGPIAGVLGGSATVANISHTLDSIMFRNAAPVDITNVLYLDFLAKTDSGSVSNLLLDPCINTSGVLVTGPLSTNSNEVVVNGVVDTASVVTVYQDSGSGMTPIGTKTSGITAGQNIVTVSGLVKAAQVVATQTVGGQESCIPPSGIFVGGGANPAVRVAITIRETPDTGPIGAAGASTANLHFLGATTVSGSAPVDAKVIYPSNEWQTLTFEYSLVTVGDVDSGTTAWTPVAGAGYPANDLVALQVFAYKIVGGVKVFSANPAYTQNASSPEAFNLNWTWDAVADADGYRLLRSVNFDLYNNYVDVPSNSYLDQNSEWTAGDTVTPTVGSITPAVQWNPTVGALNSIATPWGTLESINFVLYDQDSGPFDLFIDSIQNGDTVFQTFDDTAAGTVDYGFRAPSFSGSTGPGLLSAPNIGEVSDLASADGPNSFRVSYQWNGTNATKWLRLTTSGVGNPMVDLSQPISFKILLTPVGFSPATPPGNISITRSGNDVILDWAGSFYLQSATEVNGTYTDVTDRVAGPYTNTVSGSAMFFRLRN